MTAIKSRRLRHVSLLAIIGATLAVSNRIASAEKKPGVTIEWPADNALLGSPSDPVPPPAQIDPKYTAEGLRNAFATLCKQLGYRVQRVTVDQSEFPFLLHGVLEGRCDYREIRDALQSMRGYAYTGSVTGHTNTGSTYFALNMTPPAAYPRSHAEAIRRRLLDRLKALMKNGPR